MRKDTHNGMMHLNGNLLCVVDVETTGLDPSKCDLIEICVLPLDGNLNVHRGVLPFEQIIQPKREIDFKTYDGDRQLLLEAKTKGLDAWKAVDLFEEWFERLNLGDKKRISPLAHNYPFDRGFLIEWLGLLTYEHIFDGRYRDTMACALYENDKANFRASNDYPFPKVNLSYLCSQLKVQNERSHRALYDCMATAECYKKMLTSGFTV